MVDVCVVGGGLAGLSAAIELADAGAEVTLVEARPRLGGATFSFARDGLTMDNGQHLFLRCCTEYRRFLDRIGSAAKVSLQPQLAVPVLAPGGAEHRLARSRGPAPLHLAAAVARYRLLGAADKLRAGRALLALRRLDRDDPATDAHSFGQWLREHGQSPAATEALWRLISVPTLNARPDDTSLASAAMVFQTGLLERADAADIGIPQAPLSELHAEPAERALRAAGARVATSAKVTGIEAAGAGHFTVRLRRDRVEAAAVVVAVPHDAAGQLLDDPRVRRAAAGLAFSPIVNLHLLFDRPVTSLPFAVGVGNRIDWVFDRTASAGVEHGQYLTVSLSAADDLIDQPVAALRETMVPAMAELFPAIGRAELRRFHVTREPHATFRPAPGVAALRPDEMTDTPGVFVAGSWTDTGWPATMEGAVRSGTRAARRALDWLGAAGAPASTPAADGEAPHDETTQATLPEGAHP